MEEIIKERVACILEAKTGHRIKITGNEWSEAKAEALNDIYINVLCEFKTVTPDYFIAIMGTYLMMRKQIPQ